jgi:hypothetical protein
VIGRGPTSRRSASPRPSGRGRAPQMAEAPADRGLGVERVRRGRREGYGVTVSAVSGIDVGPLGGPLVAGSYSV